jgi:Tfp pilus assembly major pilin PilA
MSLPYDPIDGVSIMPRNSTVKQDPSGFSLLEVLLIVAVGLILTAVGLPLMNNVIANMKLRASMTSVSGLLQNTRATAVQQNKTMTAKHFNRTTAPYSLIYYVQAATDASGFSTTDTQVWMEAPITPYPAPTGVVAPTAIGTSTLSFTAQSIDPSVPYTRRSIHADFHAFITAAHAPIAVLSNISKITASADPADGPQFRFHLPAESRDGFGMGQPGPLRGR